MHIQSASLTGFRNLVEGTFDFSPRVNLVLGRNGEGKTNFLEALNFFALGRSHRGCPNEDLIAFNEENLYVKLNVAAKGQENFSCEYGLERQGERRYKIDGQPVVRRSDLVGKLATVFFNPETTQLVRGGPRFRRQYLDQGRSEIDPVYLRELGALMRALRQKGSLLRDHRKKALAENETRRELAAWNQEIARTASAVCSGRLQETTVLNRFVQENHKALLDNDLKLELIYKPRLETFQSGSSQEIQNPSFQKHFEQEIEAELDYIMEQEIRRGRLLAGPQFDDLEIRLEGLDLRQFGSQGETRTAAIAMTLARSDVLFETRGIRPVIFFDDIFSELDGERAARLQEMAIRLHQVFIATARTEDIDRWSPADLRRWQVRSGQITRED